MPIKAYCQAAVVSGSLVKVLLTWQESPNHPQETALLNILKEHIDFESGDIVELIIRKPKESAANDC